MIKKSFVLPFILTSLIIISMNLPGAYAFDLAPTPSVEAQCPAACPCCDELMPGLLDGAQLFNDLLGELNEGMELEDGELDFPDTKKRTEEKVRAARLTQSSDPQVADQAWNDYWRLTKEMREIEQEFTQFHNDVDEYLDAMKDAAQALSDAIDKFLACPCLGDIDAC